MFLNQRIVFLCVASFFALIAQVGDAFAQTANWQWREITPTTTQRPTARRNGAAVYDPVNQQFIIFGGMSDSGLLNDTWAFNFATRTWTKLNTVGTPPPARFAFDTVYDPVGHQMVIYAGQGVGFFNDTWTLNLTTLEWREVSPSDQNARPKKRYGSAAIFDPVTRSLVSFAGFTSEAGRFQDTQSFSLANNAWTDWTPSSVKPQVRCLLTAAFDRANRRMVIYGGQRNGQLDDIWSFDLVTRTWIELTPAQRPTGRWFASSAVDKSGQFLLFGGFTSNGVTDELWSFNLQTRVWTRLQVPGGPTARNGALSAYIESEDRWLLFGGTGTGPFNDLWELRRPSTPATVTTVSAASFSGERQAPESIVAAFGANLATIAQAATATPLPLTLAGTSVKVRDSAGIERTAPLFFVSPTQINFLIPTGTANGAATLTVMANDATVATGALAIESVAPGLFAANANGQGVAAAVVLRVKADNSQSIEPVAEWNAAQNRFVALPIDLGAESEQVFVILFGSGLRYHRGLESVMARLGGTPAPVSFVGAQGMFAGLDQANVRIPRSLIGRGEIEVVLGVDGSQANSVRLQIKWVRLF